MSEARRIGVVGAGIAGLTAAWRLQRAGHVVEVFEAERYPGGRMGTLRAGGFSIDLGVHMLLEHYDRTRALVDEVGLTDQWFALEAGPGGVLRDHALSSFSPKSAFDVLRYRGINLAGRVRLFVELARAWRWRDDLDFFDLSIGGEALDAEDLETFSRRRMGDEATDYVVDSFIRTFHFHGARKMSVKYFEALAALLVARGEFRSCALRGYMGALPTALAAQLDVRFASRVSAITPTESGAQLVLPDGSRTFDEIVLATTPGVAAALLTAPSPAQRALLEHAEASCTVVCCVLVPCAIAADFEGIWVPFVESELVCALSNETAKGSSDGQHCVFSVFLHEEAARALLASSDAAIHAIVAAEVGRLFPRYAGHLEPLLVQRWSEALPVYGVGQVTRVAAFWASGQGDGHVWLCGDYLNHPWVEGAVRCGEKVAHLISQNATRTSR